jgi:hypothetical protein
MEGDESQGGDVHNENLPAWDTEQSYIF